MGDNRWTLLVGEKCIFLAPVSGLIIFRINDPEFPAEARAGSLDVTVSRLDVSPWESPSGEYTIGARIDAVDYLNIMPDGIFWEYGGEWSRVGEHKGRYPTVINDVCWWPRWMTREFTERLPLPGIFPAENRELQIVRVEARRGACRIHEYSAKRIVLQFRDTGLNSSHVSVTVGYRDTGNRTGLPASGERQDVLVE
jgi:hypothetical protein